jgi:hypothetical protein
MEKRDSRHLSASICFMERGFFFDRADDDPHPDAWCRACERLRIDNGGDWTEALTKQVNIQLVCDSCYLEIRERNSALIQ